MKLHVFATILALYPFTKTEEIAEEFGISVNKIRRMARICRVSKNAEFRSEIGKMNGRKSVDRFVRRKIRREQRSLLHAKKSGVKLNRKS